VAGIHFGRGGKEPSLRPTEEIPKNERKAPTPRGKHLRRAQKLTPPVLTNVEIFLLNDDGRGCGKRTGRRRG